MSTTSPSTKPLPKVTGLDPETRARVLRVAERGGVSVASVLRLLVRSGIDQVERSFGEMAPRRMDALAERDFQTL